MESEKELKTWVSDKVILLMGYSHSTVVQYVIAVSKKASSGSDLAEKLLECGLSSSAETRRFSDELFSRGPLKAAGLNMYQKQEREAALLVKKQRSYTILEADEEETEAEADVPSTADASHSTKESGKKKQFRKVNDADENEDNEEVKVALKDERRVKRRTSKDDDEDDSESDEEIRRDRREREQLEKSLRDRDAAGTRKLMEQKISKKEEEEAIRRSKALEEDSTDTLRKVSRQEYLKKREQKKLDELRLISHS